MNGMGSESDAGKFKPIKSNSAWENVIDIEETMHKQKSIEEVVEIARKAFDTGRTRKIEHRETQLKNLLRFLEERVKDIEDALYKVGIPFF